jgi:hypothetical protein
MYHQASANQALVVVGIDVQFFLKRIYKVVSLSAFVVVLIEFEIVACRIVEL